MSKQPDFRTVLRANAAGVERLDAQVESVLAHHHDELDDADKAEIRATRSWAAEAQQESDNILGQRP